MSLLSKSVYRMTNPELIGLAKNRFLDSEDQVAIAKHHYRRAHSYLCENAGLKTAARDVLWDYNGYVLKCELLAYGHYKESPEKYIELYDKYAHILRSRSPWRITRTFVQGFNWWSHGSTEVSRGSDVTPASILEDIYEKDVVSPNRTGRPKWYSYSSYSLESKLAAHPNTPIEVIVKISASSENDEARKKALARMAQI